MPETILSTEITEADNKVQLSCSTCGRLNEPRVSLGELPSELAALLKANTGVTPDLAQVCTNCIELFSRARAQIDSHHVVFEQTDHVLPTPLRMNADERFTGRGVTIAFLDSGFYEHDDLTKPENRIVAYHS